MHDVPITIEDAMALHDPPETVASLKRVTKKTSRGGGCGHSIACVLLLPIYAYHALFPEDWDELTIKTDDRVWYEARFSTKGEFLFGTHHTEAEVILLQLFDLQELNRRIVLKASKGPPGGPFQKIPILDQAPLDRDYVDAIAKSRSTKQKVKLALEAVSWLKEEATPLFQSFVRELEGDELTDSLPKLIRGSCEDEPHPGTCDSVMERARTTQDDKVIKAVIQTTRHPRHQLSHEDIRHFLQQGMDKMCEQGPMPISMQRLHELGRNPASRPTPKCTDTRRNTLLRVAVNLPVSDEELLDSVSDLLVGAVIEYVSPKHPRHADFVLGALELHPRSDGVSAALSSVPEFEPDHLPTIVAAYRNSSHSLGSHISAAYQLQALHRAAQSNADLRKIRSGLIKETTPQMLIARAVLGERQKEGEAVQGLKGRPSLPSAPFQVHSRESLIGYGLFLNGCTEEDVSNRSTTGRICK